jgi:hypothetical protein
MDDLQYKQAIQVSDTNDGIYPLEVKDNYAPTDPEANISKQITPGIDVSVEAWQEFQEKKAKDRAFNEQLKKELGESKPVLITIDNNELYNAKNIVNEIHKQTIEKNDKLQKSFTPDLLAIPNWNLKDFIEERKKYVFRGLPTLALSHQLNISDKYLYEQDEKGYFFFKVFFNFYTGYGLLGGLLNNNIHTDLKVPSINTALNYLKVNSNSNRFTEAYRNKLFQKCLSLEKFGELLNYLMIECPWYFKEIGGIQEAVKYDFEDLTKERKITLSFNPDAIDFRVSALMELYLDACFDPYNHKEIVPSNLRKFDMSVLICQVPIKGHNIFGETYHGFNLDKTTNYLDTLTFKWILFQNCEFDYKSIASVVDSVNSESPFEMEYSVEIIAERTYVRDFNPDLNLMDIFSYMPNL